MSDLPKRRLVDRIGQSPTFVAEGTAFVGDLETAGALVMSGEVRGNGRVGGTLSMGSSATWLGDILARQAVVAGKVTGKLQVEEKLEIGATAVIKGEIRAKVLAIAHGAIIDGEVNVTSGQPIVQFDEKRKA
jgi:cytoskeletal protein CcmA (bactofilin family)